ncbi:MAG: hypothetical protein IMY83_02085 [Chloroflexi bacterium]|nr:hypothetical protein [Chloroflexota bacterium]
MNNHYQEYQLICGAILFTRREFLLGIAGLEFMGRDIQPTEKDAILFVD